MGKDEWTLARISDTYLGIEDHGFLTYIIGLDYADPGEKIGSGHQGFGLRVLWTKKHGGTRASIALIAELLEAVGVEAWGQLVGKMIWAQADFEHVHRIKGLDTGITFDPEETVKRTEAAAGEEK